MQLIGRFAQPVGADTHLNIRLHMAARAFRLEEGSATLGRGILSLSTGKRQKRQRHEQKRPDHAVSPLQMV
jgi:hypothetical protein